MHFTNHDALQYASFRMIHPRVSYHTFHRENRNYQAVSANYSTRIDFLTYICLTLASKEASNVLAPTTCANLGFHHISVLSHFASTDWHGVFQGLDSVLDKVDSEMSINTVLQDRIYGWRYILGEWRKQLVNDKAKISAAIQIIEEFGVNGCSCKPLPGGHLRSNKGGRANNMADINALQKNYNELLTRATNLIDRTERTFAAIMSSMSIVESQRAISQAESVSRVTELAFIFIPLSFAASIFGMDIPGWSENYTPTLWVAISVGLVTGAYLLRLTVRARLVNAAIEKMGGSLSQFGNIEDDGPIPTSTFIKWVFWKVGLAVLGLGAVVAGIVCVWKYVDSNGAQIAATVILSLVGFLWCISLYLWRSWRVLFKDYERHLRRQPSTLGVDGKEDGKFLNPTTEAKLKLWRDLTWKDIFYPEGRKTTVRTAPMM